MQLKTELSCGDKVWYFDGAFATELTIGQVRVEYTYSLGCTDFEFRGSVVVNGGDNYASMPAVQEEMYMCTETGVGSGNLYKLGVSIFLTKEACLKASADRIAELERERLARVKREEDALLREETALRTRLARIDAVKASRK